MERLFNGKGVIMRNKRIAIIFRFVCFAFAFLVLRIFLYQIVLGESLSRAASSQRMVNSEIEKVRGDILDRNDISFTSRDTKYILVIQPAFIKADKEAVNKLIGVLGDEFYNLEREIEFRKEPIIFEINRDLAEKLKSLRINGVSLINSLKRYGEDSLARHIVGYLNIVDHIGQAGIERFYDSTLSLDRKNDVGVITDGRNNLVLGMGYRIVKSPADDKKLNVRLTIDYHIQKIVEEAMEEAGITGAVVVEDVYKGDIVAMASKPDFDQNDVASYLESEKKELFNRSVASYNLGSIFKIVDCAVMLRDDSIFKSMYFCTGSIKVGDKEYECSNVKGHGFVDIRKAFAYSCNSFFINEAIKTGAAPLLEEAEKLGLGRVTGIIEQGVDEASGNLPSPGRYYSSGDIANLSIGQGDILATPVQVADLVATIANGGIKNRINIVDSIVDEEGNKIRELKTRKGERVMEKEVAARIKDLMEGVLEFGTASHINLEKYGDAAGKTGSAETGLFQNGQNVVQAWFAGYFPRKTPKYSVAVFVENGRMGGVAAAPVFEKIAAEIMRKGY